MMQLVGLWHACNNTAGQVLHPFVSCQSPVQSVCIKLCFSRQLGTGYVTVRFYDLGLQVPALGHVRSSLLSLRTWLQEQMCADLQVRRKHAQHVVYIKTTKSIWHCYVHRTRVQTTIQLTNLQPHKSMGCSAFLVSLVLPMTVPCRYMTTQQAYALLLLWW